MGFGRWPLRIVRGSGGDLYIVIDDATKELAYKFIDTTVGEFAKYRYLEYYIAGGGGAGGRGVESGSTNLKENKNQSLSYARRLLSAAAIGNKIVFYGGIGSSVGGNIRIDIYDTDLNTLTQKNFNISNTRHGAASASANTKIVFAGGYSSNSTPMNTVYIYDINTDNWSTATLTAERAALAGAGIGDKIIFAGGLQNVSVSNAAYYSNKIDIYNIDSNSWTSSTTLSLGRYQLAGASCKNKILFAGGQSSSTVITKRVDIYDNTNNSWSNGDFLSVARKQLVGASAGNKIVFAGGIESATTNVYSDVVDIYNVDTNSWSSGRYLSVARSDLAAAGTGSKIIFAGGIYNDAATNNNIHTDTVDIYDVVTDTWTNINTVNYINKPILSIGRRLLAGAGTANKIIFAGGRDINNTESNVIDIYNTDTNTWELNTVNLKSYHRSIVSITALDNKIFFAGGYFSSNNTVASFINIYNIKENTRKFTNIHLGQARFQMGCYGLKNRVVFAGGNSSNINTTSPSSYIDAYNTDTNALVTWGTRPTLQTPRYRLAAAGVGNYIFFAGGNTRDGNINPEAPSSKVDIYNVTNDTRTNGTDLSTARYNMAAVAYGDRVYFIGGRIGTSSVSKAIDIYKSDGTKDTSLTITLPNARAELAAVAVGGKIYCAGGSTGTFGENPTHTVEVYDIASGTWETMSQGLSDARSNLGAASLGSKIMFVGGNTTSITTISKRIDIYDINTKLWTNSTFTQDSDTYISGITCRNYAFFTTLSNNSTTGIYPLIYSLNIGNDLVLGNASGGGGSGYQKGYLSLTDGSKNYALSANQSPAETAIDLSENRIVRIDISMGAGAAVGDLSGQPTILRLWANDNTLFRRIDASGGLSGRPGTKTAAGAGGAGFFGGGGGFGGSTTTDISAGGIGQIAYSGSASSKSGTTYTSGAGGRPNTSYSGGSISYTSSDSTKVAIGGGGGGGGGYLGNTDASGAVHDILANYVMPAASGSDYTGQGGGGGAGDMYPGRGGKGFAILKFSKDAPT